MDNDSLTHLVVDDGNVPQPHLLSKVVRERRISVLPRNSALPTVAIRRESGSEAADSFSEAPSITIAKMKEAVTAQKLRVEPGDLLDLWRGARKSGLYLPSMMFSSVCAGPFDLDD